jgi:hypothetical protein
VITQTKQQVENKGIQKDKLSNFLQKSAAIMLTLDSQHKSNTLVLIN